MMQVIYSVMSIAYAVLSVANGIAGDKHQAGICVIIMLLFLVLAKQHEVK